MTGRCVPRLLSACALAILAGCGAPPAFTVDTVIHPDGSCDRTICQPRYEGLPPEALKPEGIGRADLKPDAQPIRPGEPLRPEWVAHWESVKYVKGPPASPRAGRDAGKEDYFLARGSFRSPRGIPPHYRLAAEEFPQVGASELVRDYERIDRVFVVEHRWSERVTDVVTLPGFLEARDKLLDILVPLGLRLLGEEFGPDYDLSGLSDFVRRDVRRALDEAVVIVYDAGARRRLWRGDAMDREVLDRLAALSRRIGLDPLDANGNALPPPEMNRRLMDFSRRVVLEHVRHRDGSALGRSDWDALVARWSKAAQFMKTDQRQDERLRRFAEPLLLRLVGLHGVPLAFLSRGGARFEFTLKLPGELIATSGVGLGEGRTRWSFTGDDLFPQGYEMSARSVEIDREAQKKALGRVAIDDAGTATEFLDLIGEDASLLEAVRRLRDAGDRGGLERQDHRSPEQIIRARRLREILLGR